jgi:GDP-L-fucose synthase
VRSDLEDAHVIPALIHKCYNSKSACLHAVPSCRPCRSHRAAENKTPFIVAGTGKPLRQFIYSRDLAKLFIWQLREYDDVSSLILSVGEDEEISIKQVNDAIVKALDFTGDYTVRSGPFIRSEASGVDGCAYSLTRARPTASSASRRRTRSS